jgi:hypothetical protein
MDRKMREARQPAASPDGYTGQQEDPKTGETFATYKQTGSDQPPSSEELAAQRAAENPKAAARLEAARQRKSSSPVLPMADREVRRAS